MSKQALSALIAVAALAVASVAQAQQAPWLHVRVTEQGEHGSNVSVNVPLSLVEVALDIAEREAFHGRHFRFHDDDIDIDDLRRVWREVRQAGDTEFVNVEERDTTVRVSRQGDRVIVEFQDEGDEKGRIEVPVSVVDVLLEGEGNELNIRGALEEMVRSGVGEIVMVEDDRTHVRVWIE